MLCCAFSHNDVIKWKHFPRYWPFVRGIQKGQWRGSLMFSLICVWINGWVNNREAGDLRRYRAHYDVTVMICDSVRVFVLSSFFPFLVTFCMRINCLIEVGWIDDNGYLNEISLWMTDFMVCCTILLNEMLINAESSRSANRRIKRRKPRHNKSIYPELTSLTLHIITSDLFANVTPIYCEKSTRSKSISLWLYCECHLDRCGKYNYTRLDASNLLNKSPRVVIMPNVVTHYNDVIMSTMASEITSLTIAYSTIYSGLDQRKHQSSASLAFVRGIHRWIPRTKAQ